MIRVLIADNYPIVRYGLKQVLTGTQDIQVVGEAVNRSEVFHKTHATRCNVLLLETLACDAVGLEILAELRYTHPTLAVLMMGMRTEAEFSIRALRSGASGHITIDSTPDEFIRAIRMVANGRRYINEELAEALALGIQTTDENPRHSSLTDREYQVMCMLGSGKTPTETARTLGLAKTTIATYRTRVLEKLNLRSSAEIIHYTVKNQLVH